MEWKRWELKLLVTATLLLSIFMSPEAALTAQLTLSWEDTSPNADGYAIERQKTGSGSEEFTLIAVQDANMTSYTDVNLAGRTTYCYRVRAFNVASLSAYSNKMCVTTPTPPPQNFTVTVNTTGSGSGTIRSIPAGINCGSDCSESYTSGTAVTLTITPAPDSTFSGWSEEGCSRASACTVIANMKTSLTATFESLPPSLSLPSTGTRRDLIDQALWWVR